MIKWWHSLTIDEKVGATGWLTGVTWALGWITPLLLVFSLMLGVIAGWRLLRRRVDPFG